MIQAFKSFFVLFLQIFHSKQKRVIFLLWPRKLPCHPKRKSLTYWERSKATQNRQNITDHSSKDHSQCIRLQSVNSSCCIQKQHLFTMAQPLLIRWSMTRHFLYIASQTKKLTSHGTLEFEIFLVGKDKAIFGHKNLYDLMVKMPFLDTFHASLSTKSPHVIIKDKGWKKISSTISFSH